MSELVSRLQRHYDHVTTDGAPGDESADLVKEAAERIRELQAEVAAHERNTEKLNASWHSKCQRLEAEVARLKGRNSCAACQDENTRLVSENASLSANFNGVCHKRDHWKARAEAAEAKLKAVGELPGKWRDFASFTGDPAFDSGVEAGYADAADELEALLKEVAL